MKFSINYNAHSSAVSPGSRVWLEGSGSGGRLGTAAGGSAVLEPRSPASTAMFRGPSYAVAWQHSQGRETGRW